MAQPTPKPPPYRPASLLPLTQRDFESASLRSAAPSYTSAAPSYHSSLPVPSSSPPPRRSSAPEPSLAHFTPHSGWSTVRANPTARHYHSVAHRRASASNARIFAAAESPNPMKTILETLEDEERRRYTSASAMSVGEDANGGLGSWERLRPLEDPELVGEAAAEQARRERLGWGKGVLEREDRRWDWLLGQMKDWEEREKSWGKFRNEVENGKRRKLARRLGL